MAVTAGMVKELREISGAGMLDCKKALEATSGDIEKAVEFLREKGLAAAAKKAGRVAAEGLVYDYITEDSNIGVLVEVNSETDFVAKNDDFKSFVVQVAKQVATSEAKEVDTLLNDQWQLDPTITVKDVVTQKVATIGENIGIRRFVKFEKSQAGALVSYRHGEGRIAVLIELACEKQADQLLEVGKDLAMQIAALNPKFVTRDEVPAEHIEKEREILKQQALNEGKPANIVEKMVEGRLSKELKEVCLIDQAYVKDPDMTVAKYLDQVGKEIGAPISVKRFARFETGEGIEKKQENFAEEVAKAMQN